jgi:hypothetical protein
MENGRPNVPGEPNFLIDSGENGENASGAKTATLATETSVGGSEGSDDRRLSKRNGLAASRIESDPGCGTARAGVRAHCSPSGAHRFSIAEWFEQLYTRLWSRPQATVNPLASGLLISSEELPVYDTNTSRWLQPDPEGFDALDPNLYRGMGNDPTNATDPTGLEGRHWTGIKNDDWNNPENWAPRKLPGPNDDVTIPTIATNKCVITSRVAVRSLVVERCQLEIKAEVEVVNDVTSEGWITIYPKSLLRSCKGKITNNTTSGIGFTFEKGGVVEANTYVNSEGAMTIVNLGTIRGAVINQGFIGLEKAPKGSTSLTIQGTYTQKQTGKLSLHADLEGGELSGGSLIVSEKATLAGKLLVGQGMQNGDLPDKPQLIVLRSLAGPVTGEVTPDVNDIKGRQFTAVIDPKSQQLIVKPRDR